MLGFKKKGGPNRPFVHAPDCKIMKVDPTTEIKWQEHERGLWIAECVCGKEYERETPADQRVRLDPLDPATFRHLGGCEQRDTTDPAVIRAILKVSEGAGGGYWWVQCDACDGAWQVPYYAAESGGNDEPAAAPRSSTTR
jgi:hypothetical protein